MKTNENQSLESLIAAIQELLYELKNEQDDILTRLDKEDYDSDRGGISK